MKITLVTSWPTVVTDGSGTAVFFNTLVDGLRARGYDLDIIAPNFDISDYVTVTLQRFLFNTRLRTDPRLAHADVMIGLDYDGFGLDPLTSPPLISSAHAVYGDVIQWEKEPFRTMVEAQAFFDRIAMEQAAYVTIGSAYAKQRIVELYGIDADKIGVIPHGLPIADWITRVNATPHLVNDHPVILAVGKMYPRKRFDILIRAAALLLPYYPTLEIRIAGDGLTWDDLHRVADEVGMNRNVTWLGYISSDDQRAYEWSHADIFCHPSNQETFGFVYLEAMLAGLPIVAVRAGAAPEVIGNAGRLAEPENPAALAAELDYFLKNDTARIEYGQRGHERASLFNVESMIDGYEAVITRVTQHR